MEGVELEHEHVEREGADITASDMLVPEDDSDIKNFYHGSTVFITGATGFLGKLAMEKLLRTCDVSKIYILVRSKKGKSPQKRFEELFDEPSFEPLMRKDPSVLQRVHTINGDTGLPNLGLSDEDLEIIKSEVDVVLHFAATVRFDEKLRIATNINVRAVRDLVRIGKQMKHLRALIHVSTAFSNCVRTTIEEKFYDPPITADKLIALVDCLDDNKLDDITTTILGEYPNTYAFTKCVAEDALKKEGKNLPVGLYRPSIVIATLKEPVAGWIDNIYGATGVLLGVAVGLLRVLQGRSSNHADMVPADYVINSVLAAAWDVATIKSINDNKEVQDKDSREEKFESEIPVYNFVSTPEKPLTWELFQDLSTKHCLQIPSEKCIWHSTFTMTENVYIHAILVFLLHTLPAYIVDFLAICIGRKPMLVKGYQKINKFANVLSYFCQRQWKFSNDNVQSLWRRLKKQDQELFEFSMKKLDWDLYFYTYTRGGRVYIMKDPLDTVPKGKLKYWKLLFAHYLLIAVLAAAFFKIIMVLYGFIF